MQGKRLLAALTAALMLSGASGLAFAQQPAPKPAPGMPMDQGMMGGGMMGGDMMGMMNMMHECQRMMRGGAMGGAMMPQMPPGNEKLQFQMQAEMMQRMGEIAAKYAERIKEDKPRAPR
jgi:hypothetical protein